MNPTKLAIATLALASGLASPARAQTPAQPKTLPGGATAAYPASQLDGTAGPGYYAMFPGAVNYGLSGTYPDLGGYGFSGYGPGPQFGAYFPAPSGVAGLKPASPPNPGNPPASSGLNDLSKTIRKATMKPTKGPANAARPILRKKPRP